MANLTVDILRNWFTNVLDLSCTIESVVYDPIGGISTLVLDDILHIRNDMVVTISGTDYVVQTATQSTNTITLLGDLTSETSLIIEALYYTHGTPLRTNADISNMDIQDKYPMAYVYEQMTETLPGELSPIKVSANVRLHLLDTANLREWTNENHYDKRIRGIAKLADRIIQNMRNDKCCFDMENATFDRINIPNWGVFTESKGTERFIFNEMLSGVELRFNLVVKKNCNQL